MMLDYTKSLKMSFLISSCKNENNVSHLNLEKCRDVQLKETGEVTRYM